MTRSHHPLQLACGTFATVLLLCGAAARAAAPEPSEVSDGALIDQMDRRNRAFEGFLRAEVASQLKQARDEFRTRPEEAEKTLTQLLEHVRRTSDLGPDVRAQLVAQIESALRSARCLAQARALRQLAAQHNAALHTGQDRSLRDLVSRQRKVGESLSQFNALMAEGRYRDAETLASVAEETLPGQVALRTAVLKARLVGATADMNTVRSMAERGWSDTMQQVDVSAIPMPDQPPILYPDPEAWQLLTNRRQKHLGVDMKRRSTNEAKILAALNDKTEFDFIDQPLSDVVDYLKQRHGIEIQLDKKALAAAGVDAGVPITRSLNDINLRSALWLLLRDLDLTYVISHEVLLITSNAEADTMRDARVYPVADLVSRNPFVRRGARRFIRNMPSPTVGGGTF